MVVHNRPDYTGSGHDIAVAGHVRQVVVNGRDVSMQSQSVLSTMVIDGRWSSIPGVT